MDSTCTEVELDLSETASDGDALARTEHGLVWAAGPYQIIYQISFREDDLTPGRVWVKWWHETIPEAKGYDGETAADVITYDGTMDIEWWPCTAPVEVQNFVLTRVMDQCWDLACRGRRRRAGRPA